MRVKAIFVAIMATSLLWGSGCGSSGGTLKPGAVGVPAGAITRATESSFSRDARILAARESTDGWISAAVATQVDGDLTRIRANTPAVAAIHALALQDPDSLIVEVSKSASWLSTWEAGTVITGVAAIDNVSQTYQVTGVSKIADLGGYTAFKLIFANPHATSFIADKYKTADAGVRNAYPNNAVGDGDNIMRRVGSNRVYDLSKGWGDCTAGCIMRHVWEFTLAPDGGITVTESGAPLPPTP